MNFLIKKLLKFAEEVSIQEVGARGLSWVDEKAEATSDLVGSLGYKQWRSTDKPEVGTFMRVQEKGYDYTWVVQTPKHGQVKLTIRDVGDNQIEYTVQHKGGNKHKVFSFHDFRDLFTRKLGPHEYVKDNKPFKPDIR